MRVRRILTVAIPILVSAAVVVPEASADQWTLQAPELNYVVLFEGNAGRTLSINNFGTTGVWTGNIGIGNTGQLAASGPGTLNGNIDFAAANTGQASISNTTINGSVNYGVPGVTTALNDINDLSRTLGLEAGTSLAINTHTTGSQTVDVNSGLADGHGNMVFTVTSFQSNNGENLTIYGDGSSNVVFNIHLTTSFSGNILLAGGITADQVIFNMPDGAALAGGDTLQANNNGNNAHPANIMYGVFLDPNGKVSFVNTRLVGRIFGGDTQNMAIVSGVTLTQPSQVPESSSLVFLLSGLGATAVAWRRRRPTA